jgi:hypothetical protein
MVSERTLPTMRARALPDRLVTPAALGLTEGGIEDVYARPSPRSGVVIASALVLGLLGRR